VAELFPDAPEAVSLRRQLACASRELFMRQRVYPGRVKVGRMTEADAREEIAAMRAIVQTLRRVKGR
jgi:hypothetical protein